MFDENSNILILRVKVRRSRDGKKFVVMQPISFEGWDDKVIRCRMIEKSFEELNKVAGKQYKVIDAVLAECFLVDDEDGTQWIPLMPIKLTNDLRSLCRR